MDEQNNLSKIIKEGDPQLTYFFPAGGDCSTIPTCEDGFTCLGNECLIAGNYLSSYSQYNTLQAYNPEHYFSDYMQLMVPVIPPA